MNPVAEIFHKHNLDCAWKVFKRNSIDLEREAIRMRIDINTIFVRHIVNNIFDRLTDK